MPLFSRFYFGTTLMTLMSERLLIKAQTKLNDPKQQRSHTFKGLASERETGETYFVYYLSRVSDFFRNMISWSAFVVT